MVAPTGLEPVYCFAPLTGKALPLPPSIAPVNWPLAVYAYRSPVQGSIKNTMKK